MAYITPDNIFSTVLIGIWLVITSYVFYRLYKAETY